MQILIRKPLGFARKGTRILVDRLRHQGVRVTLIWMVGRGLPKLTGIPLVRYSRITPEVWVGGQFGKRGKHKLERHGITGVVNLRTEFDDADHDLALSQYCHLPTIDDDAPTIEHLQQGAAFMQRVIADGGQVYVHCAGGVGRAPTTAAAYFITQGHTLDEAVALIRQTRPFIRIMPPQWEQLERFEAMHRQGEQ
jgi:protein-tyrosine phosphatase